MFPLLTVETKELNGACLPFAKFGHHAYIVTERNRSHYNDHCLGSRAWDPNIAWWQTPIIHHFVILFLLIFIFLIFITYHDFSNYNYFVCYVSSGSYRLCSNNFTKINQWEVKIYSGIESDGYYYIKACLMPPIMLIIMLAKWTHPSHKLYLETLAHNIELVVKFTPFCTSWTWALQDIYKLSLVKSLGRELYIV